MRWLKQLFTRRRHYNELSETIREHLEEKLADLMNDGMTRDVAERSARRGTTWDDLRKAGREKQDRRK
jgi:3-methyladenine DNA glycosylase AlkD